MTAALRDDLPSVTRSAMNAPEISLLGDALQTPLKGESVVSCWRWATFCLHLGLTLKEDLGI